MADLADDEVRRALAEVTRQPGAPNLVGMWDAYLCARDDEPADPHRESAASALRLIARQHVREKARTARLEALATEWDARWRGSMGSVVWRKAVDELRAALGER